MTQQAQEDAALSAHRRPRPLATVLPFRLRLAACLLSTLAAGGAAAVDMPAGMLALFDQPGCPDGWSPYTAADGRLLLGFSDTTSYSWGGVSQEPGMQPSQAPTHSHTFTGTTDLGSVGLAAFKGIHHEGAEANDQTHTRLSVDAAGFGLGFIQYTACIQGTATAAAQPKPPATAPKADADSASGGDKPGFGFCSAQDSLPQSTLAFFAPVDGISGCPDGWTQPTLEKGYKAQWAPGSEWCVELSFDGVDADGDGVLRGRGTDPALIRGDQPNELTAYTMTVYENDCETGSLVTSYNWSDQQKRSDFNLNFDLTQSRLLATGAWNTAKGLNAGFYRASSGMTNPYNLYTDGKQVLLYRNWPTTQEAHSSAGSQKFVIASQKQDLNGRFLLPVAAPQNQAPDALGRGFGASLDSLKTAGLHTHQVQAGFSAAKQDFDATSGGGEHLGAPGNHSIVGSTTTQSNGLPYIQLLACQRCAGEPAPLSAATSQVVVFAAEDCDDLSSPEQAWTEATEAVGRFVVALADASGNNPDAGKPITDDTAPFGQLPGHGHTAGGSFILANHGVSAEPWDFWPKRTTAKAAPVSYQGQAAGAVAAIPFVGTRACRPCGNLALGQEKCPASDEAIGGDVPVATDRKSKLGEGSATAGTG